MKPQAYIAISMFCIMFTCCKHKSFTLGEDFKNDSTTLCVHLDNGTSVYTSQISDAFPLIYVENAYGEVDTFRTQSNGYNKNIYKSKNDSIVYLLSHEGTGRYAFITRININTHSWSFVDYYCEGFMKCTPVGEDYVIQCITHTDAINNIELQWTDTLDHDFVLKGSSDTIKEMVIF